MEKYVVSRELAEKLKAAGYFQEDTLMMWVSIPGWHLRQFGKLSPIDFSHAYAAPLSDELLEQMFGILTFTVRSFDSETGAVLIEAATVRGANYCTVDGRPADALAALWIWCRENKYV